MVEHGLLSETMAIERRPLSSDITVLIPTLGRAILEESLYHLAKGSTWPGNVIVVDQGASDQVAAWLTILQDIGIKTTYIPSSQRGRAAGLNRGLEQVGTRFVAVTDDDCCVATDWLHTMLKRLVAEPEAITTGRVEAGGADMVTVVTSQSPAVYRRPRLKFDAMSGGNMGTAMRVVERVGLFDEDPCLRTAEDGEWAYRALRAGIPIIYAPEIVVRHIGWRGEGDRARQYRGYALSHGGFYGKYLRQGDGFIALRALVHHVRALRRWIRGSATGDRELALYGRTYFTCLLPGIIAGMRKRRGA